MKLPVLIPAFVALAVGVLIGPALVVRTVTAPTPAKPGGVGTAEPDDQYDSPCSCCRPGPDATAATTDQPQPGGCPDDGDEVTAAFKAVGGGRQKALTPDGP